MVIVTHIDPLPALLRATLLIVAILAGFIDLRSRRIPNWLTLTGVIAGFVVNLFWAGFGGLLTAMEGLGLALLIYVPLWLLRGMGGGDVKLMAALGAIAGPMHWLVLFFACSMLGAVAALILALTRGRLGFTLLNTVFIAKQLMLLRAPSDARPELDVRNKDSLRMAHGAVIGAAAVLLACAGYL